MRILTKKAVVDIENDRLTNLHAKLRRGSAQRQGWEGRKNEVWFRFEAGFLAELARFDGVVDEAPGRTMHFVAGPMGVFLCLRWSLRGLFAGVHRGRIADLWRGYFEGARRWATVQPG